MPPMSDAEWERGEALQAEWERREAADAKHDEDPCPACSKGRPLAGGLCTGCLVNGNVPGVLV